MRIPIFVIIVLILGFIIFGCIIYRMGYEIGKRNIILNPKGNITDLITDFKKIR